MSGRLQKNCILVSGDEGLFEVPERALHKAKLIKQLLDEPEYIDPKQLVGCPSFMRNRRIIELPNITASVLAQAIEFCIYHSQNGVFKEIQKPLVRVLHFADMTTEWDAAFVDKDPQQISDLIMAANYLDIKSLMDLCSAKVAWMITTLDTEDIQKSIGIANTFDQRAQREWFDMARTFKLYGEVGAEESTKKEDDNAPGEEHVKELRKALKRSKKSFYIPKVTASEKSSQEQAAAQTGHLFDVARSLQSQSQT
jgi:S-phase kinase-associated protein 1